jgi:hypothetical protein
MFLLYHKSSIEIPSSVLGFVFAYYEMQHIVRFDGEPEARLFGPYFENVRQCVRLMKATETEAFGSAVLDALLPGFAGPYDGLDLAVNACNMPLAGLAAWDEFLRSEGYAFLSKRLIAERYVEVREYGNGSRGGRVKIFSVEGPTFRYVEDYACGSHVLNIATWEAMYCMFPEMTLERRELSVWLTAGDIHGDVDKYLKLGFKRVIDDQGRQEFGRGGRDFKDWKSLRVALRSSGKMLMRNT